MKLLLRHYIEDGYQDDGAVQPALHFLEVKVSSDDGGSEYVLGRLFWAEEAWQKLGVGDTVVVEGDGVKVVNGKLRAALTVVG